MSPPRRRWRIPNRRASRQSRLFTHRLQRSLPDVSFLDHLIELVSVMRAGSLLEILRRELT